MSTPQIIKYAIDLIAVLLLALGIKGLSKVRTAREANRLAALAMGFAVVGVLINFIGTIKIFFSYLFNIVNNIKLFIY